MGQADLVTNACEADSPAKTELATGNSNPRGVVALAIMLAIGAFVLRYSLSHAPYGSHVDEPIVANLTHRALQEGKLSANWDHFSGVWWTKPTYQFSPYTLVLQATTIVTHELSGWPNTIQEHIRFARTISCFLGALTVLLAFFTARALFGRPWTALLCELILAVAFLHVHDSTYARVEAFLTFAILCCFYLAAKSLLPGSAKGWSYAAAVAGGVVIAAKYNAVPILIPVAFAAFAATDPARRGAGDVAIQAIKYGLWMVIGFVVATPEILFAPRPLFQGIFWEMNHYAEGDIPFRAYDFWDNNFLYYSTFLLRLGMGWMASLLAVGYIYLTWHKKSAPYMLLLLYLYVAFVLTLLPTARFERNLEVFIAPMAIAAGVTGGAIIEFLRDSYSLTVARVATAGLLFAIVLQPALALQRLEVALRPESSSIAQFKASLPPRDDSTVTFQMFLTPPEEYPPEDRVVVADFRDRFCAAQMKNWESTFEGYQRHEFHSPWAEHNYPFSHIDTTNGPARLVVFDRPDSSETD